MDSVEILQAMNTEQNPIHWTKREQNNAIDEAVAAIEKQRTKKVIIRGLRQRYCPVCGNNGADYMYCKDCGQKLSR